jgi:hypothetical protein
MKKILTLATAFLFMGLCVWAHGASPESYLPLKDGLVWEYQNKFIDLKTNTQVGSAKAVKKNLPAVNLQGVSTVPQVFTSMPSGGGAQQESKSFIVKDANGFYVFARQTANDREPKIMPQKYYILKFPLTKGASWQQEMEGFVLRDTIEATDASVQVPAGTFTNCLMIKRVYFNPRDLKTPIQEAGFWFAPEVGNVKVDIKHLKENKEMVQELVSFKK